MNGRTLLRELRRLTGIRYNIQSSADDKGWTSYLQIVTKTKCNYNYSTGDMKFIRRSGAEYYVAKNAAVDICRVHNIRSIVQDDMYGSDTAASKMDKYIIDFNKPVHHPPTIIQNMVPYWYTSTEEQTVTSNKNYTKIILIDLENVPLLSCKDYDSDTLYIGFLTVHHNSTYKYKDWEAYHDSEFQMPESNNKCIYYTKGRYKEMVDHFMTFMSRSIIDYVHEHLSECTTIYILSKDNSALCTKECIKVMIKGKATSNRTNIKVKLISSLQQIDEGSS